MWPLREGPSEPQRAREEAGTGTARRPHTVGGWTGQMCDEATEETL